MKFHWSVLAASFATVACTGSVPSPGNAGDDGGGGNEGGSAGEPGEGGTAGGGTPDLGEMPLRRLTKWEYENTIKELLGAPPSYAKAYPSDDIGKVGFATATNTSELMATATMESADALARFALTKFDTLVPCSASGTDACAKDFIATFGQRAFRRPLTTTERAELFDLFNGVRTNVGLDFRNGLRVVLTAILQAPQFLYHWQTGDEGLVSDASGTARLGNYQLAARLSYFLWGSMPDPDLFAAAAGGKLTEGDELEKQARRLMSDTRARAMVSDFFTQLLYLDAVTRSEKDQTAHPEWTATVRASALAESRNFVQSVVFDGDGLWRTVLTAPYSWIDESLAKVYGLGNVRGSTLARQDLPKAQRAGLLTQPAFLAAQSGPADGALVTPIHRGHLVRKRLLCQTIPPPMANIVSRASTGTTTRERLKSHVSDPQCASCHSLMDDLGFAFENYDATGKWRTTDNGKTIDASGEISALESGRPKFNNAVELVNILAETPEANECMVSNLIRYGLGRLDTEGEARKLLPNGMGTSSELNVLEAMIKVVASRGFSQRLLSKGEVLP